MRLRFVLLLAAAAAPACHAASGQSRRSAERATLIVDTATPQRIAIQRQVEVSGTLLSPDQARVSSEVAGVVLDVAVQLGSTVRAGDVLVRLEPRELVLALERAESALRQVEAQLGVDPARGGDPPPDEQIAAVRQAVANRDDARTAFARAGQLRGRGLTSQVDYDTAETRLKVMEATCQATIDTVRSLKASVQDRRAAYNLARKKVDDTAIKAPVAGMIAERLVQPGEFIKENTQVVTIVQMTPLKLRTALQEKYAGLIAPGQTVDFRVEAFPERAFAGRVAYVSPAVDQTTRTFVVEAMVENPDRQLKPGFFAKGTVSTRIDQNVVAVPEEVVSNLAGVTTVYVIADGKARQQQITTGQRAGRLSEVVAGLSGTETLAATNLNQLATGTPVTIGRSTTPGGARDAASPDARRDGGRP